MRKFILPVVGLLICLLSVTFFVIKIYPRYYFLDGSRTGTSIAEEILRKKRDVTDCFRIIDIDPFPSPSAEEQSELCVYSFAELMKDPSACELLMPSSYGLSCVGRAEDHQLPCNTDVKPYSVYWRGGEEENTVNIQECIKPDASRTDLGNLCCQVAQIAFIKDKNNCASLKNNISVYDRCLYALAWKLKDPTYCSDISNKNAHKACEVQTKALAKDPSICTGCTPPVQNVEELKEVGKPSVNYENPLPTHHSKKTRKA